MDSGFSPATETFTGQASDTFQFTNASAVPDTTSVTLTTATLDLHDLSPTIDALNGTGTITNDAAGAALLSIGFNNDGGVFSGKIQNGSNADTVGLAKLGAGTETLSGANTYSGATTISAGALQAAALNSLSRNSDLADNATLDLDGFSQTIGALSGNGLVTSTTGAPTLTIGFTNDGGTFSGTIQNGSASSLALAKSGSGTEIFNSTTNTYSGGTTVNASAGILQIGDGSSFGSVGTAGVSIGSNSTLQFDSRGELLGNRRHVRQQHQRRGGHQRHLRQPQRGPGSRARQRHQ